MKNRRNLAILAFMMIMMLLPMVVSPGTQMIVSPTPDAPGTGTTLVDIGN